MNLPTHEPIFAYSADGGETFVEIEKPQTVELSEAEHVCEIGEMSVLQRSPMTLTVTTDMDHVAIIRFCMDILEVTNNMIRYHGGKPVRFVQLRKLDKCKSR